ncbi:MAG: phenylalanine--tRNA ligase subunit alpha [Actinobacteria bacterium]|nr:phenylalanine--tRNA ligase subunit alpha [Actinomycetota bacterium]
MLERLDRLQQDALADLARAQDDATLQAWKVRYLGRSAELGRILEGLRDLPKSERPAVGRRANDVKAKLEAAWESQQQWLADESLRRALGQERLDVTLPGRPLARGRLHPTTQILREILAIWAEMGFQVYRSPDVETDANNFELLNMPAYHPARDMVDTFYTTTPGVVLRTHTSPGQIRVMRERAPEPIRVVLPGMCYRYEQITARSEIQFNQVEGLAVGHAITFGDLKGTLASFARRLFGQHVRTRFRAAHFPFTEPSAEVDVECFVCGGVGCSICKGTGWLEILGSGMVHPTVLSNGGYDPAEFSGFAFGMGPERIAMLRHRINDIRNFWANDLRFLEQF